MAIDFKFPDVGEGITEGEIVKWKVNEGDSVKEHDVLAEVETDKAIVEIPSPSSGTILKKYHKEGDTVKVGETLVSIGDKGEATVAASAPTPAPAPAPKPTEQPHGGRQEGVGAVGELEEATEVTQRKPAQAATSTSDSVFATPAVRRVARDLGVDMKKVTGSGAGGRVTEEDVRKFAGDKGMKKIEENIHEVKAKVQKKYDMWGYIQRIPMKGVRKAIAKHMVEAKFTAPHVTHMDEADVTHLYNIREREKKVAAAKDIKLTYLPFVIKGCIGALRKFPRFNAAMDDEHEEIIVKKYYNIGIALDTENGLMVPVVKGADQKNIFTLAKEISDLADKGRNRELNLMDLKGGTFTITNVGSIGGVFATPIVNYPEVAILAVGRMTDKLVLGEGGKVMIRKIMPLSLSFDHRVVDGAEAARFMNELKLRLEDPDLLMMEV